jgi:hypothetical protein
LTILRWRPHTRAGLLQRLEGFAGVGMTVDAGALADAPDRAGDHAQHLEDVRLGVPLDDAPELAPAHTYRRRPGSVVYHSHPDCAAWPLEAPYVELVGAPLLGLACRDCVELWRILRPR